MDFNLTDVQRSWRERGHALGRELSAESSAADVVLGAASAGLLDSSADLLAAVVAVEALAYESAPAGVAFGLHTAVLTALGADDRFTALARGEVVGAIALSTEKIPTESGGRLSGRASLVGPLTNRGIAIVGARSGEGIVAGAVSLDASGVTVEMVETSALRGFVCGNLAIDDAPAILVGATVPFMARARILLAAAGLGMGRRALNEALHAAHALRGHGAGGEQTVQGLLADAATELDAAMLLTWKAASATHVSLAESSMAKLAATDATLRAVARATQVIGVDSFRRGHVVESLAQDVRALELFAGRTEALREAVAGETLPR
ncbi:MAG TPA: acyl-CoA dehydrogenase [Gemmatimonadaceae bacterium]|nr:acyl-CoA dehydrogenase [Gemmatimonadaceae bacterium]